ncbi:MAG: hypothetical protein ACOC8X_13570, partial [Chloroflexota bacterium]
RIPAVDDGHQANLRFIRGDHWQRGDGWIGPMLEKGEAGYASALLKVERSFIARNVIGEVTGNHLAGVLGRAPHFNVSLRRPLEKGDEPTEDEQALIDEARALLTGWWDRNHAVTQRQVLGSGTSEADKETENLRLCSVHELLQAAGKTLLATTRAALRVVIDPDVVEATETGATVRTFGSVEEALRALYVAHPPAGQATVTVDRGLNAAGVYVYEDDSGRQLAELSYLDEQGNTIIRLVGLGDPESDDDAIPGQQTDPLRLGGRLTMYEMERELFLTEPLRLLQKGVNLTLTLGSRNLVSGGFLERLFLNTSKPGSWEWDDENQRWTHVADDDYHVGEATTNFLTGLPIYDEQGNIKGWTDPTVMFRDPVPSQTFIDQQRAFYQAMLEEAKQLHTLISGDAAASGESRIQAKDTFQASLLLTKPQLDAALIWLMETLLALAADLAGQSGRYDSLRVDADAQISLGIATGDEVRAAIEAWENGVISRKTAMRRIGVEDVDAEAEELEGDAMTLLFWLGKKAEIFEQLARAGTLDEGAILRMLGVSEETAAELVRSRRLAPMDSVTTPEPDGDVTVPENGQGDEEEL